MTETESELKAILTSGDSLPFLFIGSGFTRRYLEGPNWIGLLQIFCEMIDPTNDFLFYEYQELAKKQLNEEGGNPNSTNELNAKIADIISSDFNLLWYKDKRFERNRNESKELVYQNISPFKIELARFFNELIKKPFLLDNELESFRKLGESSIAGIITTNYDCLIEQFITFDKYIGQEELLFSNTFGLCEIYKIHGCSTDPNSLIIDSNDYKRFQSKNKYLAAKLLTIFVEHPIIFLGYSIQDENIRSIIDSILDCLNEKQLLSFKKRFIFVERISAEEPKEMVIEETIYSSSSGKNMTMTKVALKDYSILYEILASNKMKYPVKVLRLLKKDIYDLVTSTKPSEKLKVMIPFENMESDNDVEYVVGVGISQATDMAYAAFSAEDIYKDIVFNDKSFIPDMLIEKTLPSHISRTCGSMPFYKYFINYKGKTPECFNKYIKRSIDEFYNNGIRKSRNKTNEKSILEIRNNYEFPKDLYYITRLNPQLINVTELQEYLEDVLTRMPHSVDAGMQYSSDLRRLIKILDWLLYYKKASIQSV